MSEKEGDVLRRAATLADRFDDPVAFEQRATADGIPENECRFIIGFCIGRLLVAGAPPEILKQYLTEIIDRLMAIGVKDGN